MKGWIKLHRQIQNHWVFENESYFRAWVTILMEVNHAENKVLIGSCLFDVKQGESLNSLDTWVSKFGKGWTKQKVRTFFSLLKADNMINTASEVKTTRLTVCNYANYQTQQHADNTLVTRSQHADNTLVTPNNNDKELKELQEGVTAPALEVLKEWHYNISIPFTVNSIREWQNAINRVQQELSITPSEQADILRHAMDEERQMPKARFWHDDVVGIKSTMKPEFDALAGIVHVSQLENYNK